MLTVWSKSKPKFEVQFPYTVSSIKFPDIWIIGKYLVSELFLLLKWMTELSTYFCVITFLPLLLCKGNNNLKILNHQNNSTNNMTEVSWHHYEGLNVNMSLYICYMCFKNWDILLSNSWPWPWPTRSLTWLNQMAKLPTMTYPPKNLSKLETWNSYSLTTHNF